MRLLMIGQSGVVAMRRVVQWALDAGHEVWLLDQENLHAREAHPNLHFVPFRVRGAGRLARFGQRATFPLQWLGAMQVRWLASRVRPDVVHAHRIDFRAQCAARAGVGPLVVSAWGSLNHLLLPTIRFAGDAAIRQVLAAAAALIVETPTLIEPSHALAGRPLRVEEIALGVDTQHFRPGRSPDAERARHEARIPDGTMLFLSPRGWAPLYCHELILEALAQARPQLRRPTLLAFLGLGLSGQATRVQYYKGLRARAAALGLQDEVRWLKPVPHERMHLLYTAADAVVSYPRTDAFPSTLLEAAACGVPILTAALAPYRGTLLETHLTNVEPENPAALAEAMVRVVNEEPAARAPRLAAARQAVQAQYEERDMAARMMALYEDVAARGRGKEGDRGTRGQGDRENNVTGGLRSA